MKLGKWVLGIAALGLVLGGVASAQTLPMSKLCLHNGSDYYVTGGFHCFPNHMSYKYFPSYAHLPGLSKDFPLGGYGVNYPWKIAGWAWSGMQGYNNYGPIWYFETGLQFSRDNPRYLNPTAFEMTWDYPVMFATNQIAHGGAPYPIYGATIPAPPTIPPPMGGNDFQCPSSCGSWNTYLNIFALGWASWNISATAPGYGWQFAFTLPCDYPICVPSVGGTAPCTCTSVMEFVYVCKGTHDEYVLMSGNEGDCNTADGVTDDGNKVRNYSIIGDNDGGWLWYWSNACSGRGEEWAMCLLLCDAVTIPVNVPGDQITGNNPFIGLGFDVGPASLTPAYTEGCYQWQWMTDASAAMTNINTCMAPYIILGGFSNGCPCPVCIDYNKQYPGMPRTTPKAFRIWHGWDLLTNTLLGATFATQHLPLPGYPACCFGTACGGHSPFPIPVTPGVFAPGTEIVFEGLGIYSRFPPSAGYMVTIF
jgi:hypothetical protein